MTIGKCLLSIFDITQNEFIFILLYLAFALYFWVQVFMVPSYGYKNQVYTDCMLLLLITIAVSVTIYLIYLIFYPISTSTEKALDRIDSTFKIILVYAIVFVVLVADLYT